MNLEITLTPRGQTSGHYDGWRFIHPAEGGNDVDPGMPSVIAPVDTYKVDMTEAIQKMSYALMLYFDPFMDGNTWHNLHGCAVAMNNQNKGFIQSQYNCGELHPDYINGTNLKAPTPLAYDKAGRQMSGNFVTGSVQWRADVGDVVRCMPGVDCIDANASMPTVREIVDRNWYVVAINNTKPPSHFAQGYHEGVQYWIAYPFISAKPVDFLSRYLQRWQGSALPDPVKVYNPM